MMSVVPRRFLLDAEPGERRAALLAFVYFFVLLASFAVLRPVRDAMAIASGLRNLPWLFTGTFVSMLVVVPLFALLTRLLPRRRFIPIVYRTFAAMTLGFYALLASGAAPLATTSAFYIWVSVYNVFVVSVFWSFMADLFRPDQARRLYGFVAAGGTVGMIAGPLFVTLWIEAGLGAAPLLLVTAVLLEVAVHAARALDRWSRGQPAHPEVDAAAADAPVAGHVLDGFWVVVRSPYLAAIALHVFLYSLTSTFLYVQQQHLVAAAGQGTDQQTGILARLDLVTQLVTLGIQVLLTGRILRYLGLAVALGTLPVITAIGSGLLAVSLTLPMIMLVQAVRRASQYAIERPAREALFTVADRQVKYRSKNFLDTIVFRGGDALTAWLDSGLARLGLGFAGLAAALVAISLGWAGLTTWLGRAQERLRARRPGGGTTPT